MSKKSRAYESYDGFLRESIRTYWESKRGKRINFLALLFACKEAWGAAWDEAKDPGMAKKVLTGAAGAAAVAVVLRLLLGGPLGLVLTAASIASLVALYVKNHKKIMARVGHFRAVIEDYRPKYEKLATDEGVGGDHRELMIEGLMSRFLDELDAYQPEDEEDEEYEDDEYEDEEEGEAPSAFARHVESKREGDKSHDDKSQNDKNQNDD
jgi:hypothetical protein